MSLSRILRPSKTDMPVRKIELPFRIAAPVIDESAGSSMDASGADEPPNIEAQLEARSLQLEQAKEEVLALLADAEQKALQVLEAAKLEAEEIRAQASMQGREEGLASGREEARQAEQKAIQQINRLLEMAENERSNRVRRSESFLVELAIMVARRIVDRELTTRDDDAVVMARSLLAEVDKAHRVEIRVASSDFASVLNHRENLERLLPQWAECVVQIDNTLRSGDVVIATEFGTVDGRLDTRFEQLRQTLLRVAKEWEAHGNEVESTGLL